MLLKFLMKWSNGYPTNFSFLYFLCFPFSHTSFLLDEELLLLMYMRLMLEVRIWQPTNRVVEKTLWNRKNVSMFQAFWIIRQRKKLLCLLTKCYVKREKKKKRLEKVSVQMTNPSVKQKFICCKSLSRIF